MIMAYGLNFIMLSGVLYCSGNKNMVFAISVSKLMVG